MDTDLRKVEKQHLPAQSSGGDAVNNILKETARSNPRLLFKKGKYFVGENEVLLGHEYVAFALDWTRGWVKWADGNIVNAEHMGRVADGYVPPERDELGDTDKSQWPDDGSDPWQAQNILPLEDVESGEFLIFVAGSFGGKFAVEKLCNRVARDLKAGKDRGLPIIQLAVAEFSTKSYGNIARPNFPITRCFDKAWEKRGIVLKHKADLLVSQKLVADYRCRFSRPMQ
jgi:hypothetical protein